jgi:putative membrane protein
MILRLTSEQHARISAAVGAAETRTAADMAVVVVPVSDRYALFPMLWAALGALIATAIASVIWPDLGIGAAIEIEVPVFVLLTLAFEWLPIRLRLVPGHTKRSHARSLAHREFAAHIVAGKAHRSRLLIFVSLGERYIEILADRDTHALVPEGTWDRIVAEFVAAVQAGHVADGILATVAACGTVLATHQPAPELG